MPKPVVMIRRNRGPRKSRVRVGWVPILLFLLVALGTALFAIAVLGF
jgi:hypothetical protein